MKTKYKRKSNGKLKGRNRRGRIGYAVLVELEARGQHRFRVFAAITLRAKVARSVGWKACTSENVEVSQNDIPYVV